VQKHEHYNHNYFYYFDTAFAVAIVDPHWLGRMVGRVDRVVCAGAGTEPGGASYERVPSQ
jgi:hypothetical protein